MNKKRIFTIIVLFIFTVQSAGATSLYRPEAVNPAVVPDPLVYSYLQCQAKYGFCTCELIGASDPSHPLAGIDIGPYDTNGDGSLGFMEMRQARNMGFFTDEQLGDGTYLACHYNPPSPGPYEPTECAKLFGEADCVCVTHMGYHYGQCLSKSIVQANPEPVSVPEEYCDHRTPGGFENCYCDADQSDAYLGGDMKCFVMPGSASQTWECETDSIRIFSGSKYTCRTLDAHIFRPDCCPGELACAVTGYDAGFGTLQIALTGAAYALKAYITYQGYAAASAAYGTAASLGSFISGGGATTAVVSGASGTSGITGAVQAYQGYYAAGQALNPALAAVGVAVAYAALAYTVYTYLSAMFNMCKEGEYELACKASAGLCIHTGEECVASGFFGCRKRVRVYMCYASQVAKIVNEYGLPQLYDPGCHVEDCDAGVDGGQCGCRSAYTTDGNATNTRHKGFTVDEFQRLDFGKIPVAEMLVKTMTPPSEATEDLGFGEIDSLTNPSTILESEGEASLSEQAPEIDRDNPPHTVVSIGSCTYNGDAMTYPISAADTEIVLMDPDVAHALNICISSPVDKPGRIYAINMSMWQDEWARVEQLSTELGISTVYDGCNASYVHYGWGDIGTFKAAMTVTAGTFFSGSSCWQPVFNDEHFYSTVPWFGYASAMEEMVVAENTIYAQDQTLLLPDEIYYSSEEPGWTEVWAYWIAEEDIRRGEWVAIEGNCFVIDDDQPELTPPAMPVDMAGNPIYDDNGYDAVTGHYFQEDPVCTGWFASEIESRGLEVILERDCTISPKEPLGNRIFAVDAGVCPEGFTEGVDCFCSCPPLSQDMQNQLMVCPRPNKNNLIQRTVGYVNPAAFNAYYGRSDVQLRYAPYIP